MVALLTHQDVCNTLPACAPANMDWGWCALRTVDPHGLYELKYRFSYIRSCSYSAPCANGEGDCDNDSDCQCVVHIPIQDIPSKIVFKVRLLRLQCWLELWSDHQLRASCLHAAHGRRPDIKIPGRVRYDCSYNLFSFFQHAFFI